ncbi:MAG: pyrrolo-quinoline quinone [Alphaproteobacteria bacterium]|nr:MAG: pyrrolo-quinoline quinone [Alphaproteobacteria bacterium]
MVKFENKKRFFTGLVMLVTAISLMACGPKNEKEDELEGIRISIITTEGDVEIDPILATVPVTLPRPYVNQNWGQAGGNPAHVNHHLSVGDTLQVAWKSKIGHGSKKYQKLVSGPVVWQGRVYVIDVKGQVSAFDETNGRLIWRTKLENKEERSNVAYGGGVGYWGGRIFATTGYGFAAALDAETGAELWRTDVGVPLRGAPTIADGRVFVNTQDNRLFTLSAEDGEVLWEYLGIVENAAVLGSASAAVEGDTVIATFSSGEIYALRAQNGQMSWQDSLSRTGRLTALATLNDIDGHPVISRGRVYIGNHSGRLVSIDMRSGDRVWEKNIGTLYTPWVAGSYMFVLTTEGALINISTRDGRVSWITQLERFEKRKKRKHLIRWAGPVLAGDRLIVVSSHGYILTISPYTGEILSGTKMPAGTVIAPIVANRTVYVLTDDGELIAYR